MTRVALTGTIGAAVLVVALGLFFAIYQQDQDDAGDAGPDRNAAVPGANSDAQGGDGATGQADQSASTAGGGAAPAQPSAGGSGGHVAHRPASMWCASIPAVMP